MRKQRKISLILTLTKSEINEKGRKKTGKRKAIGKNNRRNTKVLVNIK